MEYEKVTVLLSSYNGENYIEEQIQSVLNQKNVKVFLVIRDDGSTDDTIKILKKYKKLKNVKIHIGENLGYKKSFLWLLNTYKNSSNFLAFCDQDDVWLDKKLYSALNKLNKYKKYDYNLYFSDLTATNDNLEKIGIKKFDDRQISLGSSISRSNIAGCTMVFNYKIAEKVSEIYHEYNVDYAHDELVQIITLALNGNVYYDNNSYILFRRHSNNASSFNKSKVSLLLKEFRGLNNNYKQTIAIILLEKFNGNLSVNNKILLNQVKNYKNNLKSKIKLMKNQELLTSNFKIDIYTKMKILFGYF